MTLVSTRDWSATRKAVADRLLLRALSQRLYRGDNAGIDVLVICGAERVQRQVLEPLQERADACGVRLVLLYKFLQDDVKRVLGTDRSATVLMNLGNPQEAAAAAAEFVGRGHRFVLNQVGVQDGQSFSGGGGESRAEHRSRGGGVSNGGWSRNWTEGWSQQRQTNWSRGTSRNTTYTETGFTNSTWNQRNSSRCMRPRWLSFHQEPMTGPPRWSIAILGSPLDPTQRWSPR